MHMSITSKAVGLIGGGIVIHDRSHNPPFVIYNPFNRKVGTSQNYPRQDTPIYKSLEAAGCFYLNPPCWTEKSLSLATTENCNCECIYCFEGVNKTDHNMNLKTALKVIDDYLDSIENGQRPIIAFYGGEPTLNMSLLKECVEHLRSRELNPSLSISTNGVMSEDSLAYLLQERFYVALSVDGPSSIQDLHRPLKAGKGSSTIVERTLRTLVKEKAPFHVRVTVTSLSVQKMPEIVEYFINEGIENIHVEPVEITGACKDRHNLRPSVENFLDGFINASKIATRHKAILQTVTLRYLKSGITDHFCGTLEGHDKLYNVRGNPSLCHELLEEDEVLQFSSRPDNIKVNYPIPHFLPIIKNNHSPCFSCHLKYICGGTCPKQSWQKTENHSEPSSWHCRLSQALIPIVVSEIAQTTFSSNLQRGQERRQTCNKKRK